MTLYVTTDLRLFGKSLPQSNKREVLLEASYNLLKTYTGEESVWLPAYNFEILSNKLGRNQPKTITTGVLNTYIWQNKSEWKSQEPVFSLVGWGKKPKTYELKASKLFLYGQNSIFDELITSDAKILSFGLGISDGSTFMHMVETNRPQGPMYRYWKEFYGQYELDGDFKNLTLRMHARPNGFELEYDLPRLNSDLISNGIVEVINPELNIYIGTISEIYGFWLEKATKDPFYLLTSDTTLTFKKLLAKLGRDFQLKDFE